MKDHTSFDLLAFGAHPDDVELSAGGTVRAAVEAGHRVGIVDLTRGELGSRGTPGLRAQEAQKAADILGVAVRENLGLPDGHIQNDAESRLKVIEVLRRYRPNILLINAPECRHPDHGAAARLVIDAAYFSGLKKIETSSRNGGPQMAWRPQHILHYMQSIPFEPTLVVDVSAQWETRMRAMRAFSSQFHDPSYKEGSGEDETFVSNAGFMKWVEARAVQYGYRIGADYGEPLLYHHGPIGTDDLVGMLRKDKPFR